MSGNPPGGASGETRVAPSGLSAAASSGPASLPVCVLSMPLRALSSVLDQLVVADGARRDAGLRTLHIPFRAQHHDLGIQPLLPNLVGEVIVHVLERRRFGLAGLVKLAEMPAELGLHR